MTWLKRCIDFPVFCLIYDGSSIWAGFNSWRALRRQVNRSEPRSPSQVVDGVVHRLGGVDLKDYLESIPVVGKSKNFQPLRCNEGDVKLSPGFDLDFDLIAHTVPPFWISIHRWNSNTDTQICTLRGGIPSQNGYLRCNSHRFV